MSTKKFVKYLLCFAMASILMVGFSFSVSANGLDINNVEITSDDIQVENTETTEEYDPHDDCLGLGDICDGQIATYYPDVDDGICEGQVAVFEETTEYDDSTITITPIYDPDIDTAICDGQLGDYEDYTEYDDSTITITPEYDYEAEGFSNNEKNTAKKTNVKEHNTDAYVTRTTETKTDSPTETANENVDEKEKPFSWGWIIGGIAIAVVGIVGISAVIIIKKKK